MTDIIPKVPEEFIKELKDKIWTVNVYLEKSKVFKEIDALVEKYNKRIETYWKLDLNKGEK